MAVERRTETQVVSVDKLAIPVSKAVDMAFKMPPSRGAILLGPPGIGKTSLVLKKAMEEASRLHLKPVFLNKARAEMAEEDYRQLLLDIFKNPDKYYVIVMVSFGTVDPSDLSGIPRLIELRDADNTLVKTLEQSSLKASLAVLTVKGIHGLLLIDDALNAQDNIRRSFLQAVFNERVVGGFDGPRLSENVRVIGTGNLTSESELVTPLQKPMVGRAWMPVVREEPLTQWYHEMMANYGDRWVKDIYAFLYRHKNYYCNPELIQDEPPVGPVPRAWTFLAEAFYDQWPELKRKLTASPATTKMEETMEAVAAIAWVVGKEAAFQLKAFLSKPVPSPEEVEMNPELLGKMDLDVAFRFTMVLAHRIKEALNNDDEERLGVYLSMLGALVSDEWRFKKVKGPAIGDLASMVDSMLSSTERKKLRNLLIKMYRKAVTKGADDAKKDPGAALAAILLQKMLLDTTFMELAMA